jgi:hypothetical protein
LKTQLSDIHFEILGVNRFSTQIEIKKAYRNLIKLWHPDKFVSEPEKALEALEKSKQINEAYSFLGNYEPVTATKNKTNDFSFASRERAASFKNTTQRKGTRINILRTRVKSSNIHSIGYCLKNQILQIEFLDGNLYQYYRVPQSVYLELVGAESKGKFLNKVIAVKYRYENVE